MTHDVVLSKLVDKEIKPYNSFNTTIYALLNVNLMSGIDIAERFRVISIANQRIQSKQVVRKRFNNVILL